MEKLSIELAIEEKIADQIVRDGGPKHKPVQPLESPVIAKQHTAVYMMHRYYARRPWNVFEHIIKHYTDAGDLVFDPFCGGGVTVYEGLKLRRRVIGVDLNPLATWITEMQIKPIDLAVLEEGFESVIERFKPIADEMYSTVCDLCGQKTQAEWFEWSNVYLCPHCDKKVILSQAQKSGKGRYKCTNDECPQILVINNCTKDSDVLINKKIKCEKCGDRVIKINQDDIEQAEQFVINRDKFIIKENLFVPTIEFPDGDRARDDAIFSKGVKTFSDLFTDRGLISIARLRKTITDASLSKQDKEYLWFVFSDTLRFCNNMMARNPGWRGGNPEWGGHTYWLPNIYVETNVLKYFIARKRAITRGKKQTLKEINNFQMPFGRSKIWTYQILTQSSEKLPLSTKSIDCIITDPPFGGNVQYAELSDFWVVWLPEIHKTEGVIDNSREAIQTRHKGFATEKDIEHYEDLLYHIFKECHRVLKDNSYMVMTFHNKDVRVWMALHRAARRAGFELPNREEIDNHGMVYQPFIKNFEQTFHTRAEGSLLGDFILTFKKVKVPEFVDHVIYDLTRAQQEELFRKIKQNIEYHGGLDSTSMGNTVVEILADMNLLHRYAGRDLSVLYKTDFVKKEKKWYTKEMVDIESNKVKLFDILPVDEAIEEVLRSYFHEHKHATVDEILFYIFQRLVNSERPGMDAVNKVLNRCTRKGKATGIKREVYYWKASKIPSKITRKTKQLEIFEGLPLNHNDVIRKLAHASIGEGYNIHIGATEVRKDEKLRELSRELSHIDLGVPARAFKILKEIDLLVLKGNTIVKAIEVVTTFGTFNKAINDRYRNLLAVVPNLNFDLEVYLPKGDLGKARKELDTPANIQDGLNTKIKLRIIE